MKKKEENNNKVLKENQINLLEKNVDFDENIYFNHYFSVFGKLDFENPINERTIPYIMSREFCYSYFEVRKNIKSASKETITQIKGRIKQFSSSIDSKFNIIFLDNIKSYSEIIGIEETKNILVPVLAKVVEDKIDVKIHFLKVLHLNFIDYLCSIGDEGISILRQNIIQIIQELYRDKNITSEALKKLLFKVLVKIGKSIIPKEKDKKDNYMLDIIISFGYESNVSKEFYLEHRIICIKFISILAEDFGQDLAENYLLPQIWFFANDEEEIIKKEVLIALPNLCQELRYEIIGTKIFKLMKKLVSDKSSIIRETTIYALSKIIKIYKEKMTKNQNKEKNNDNINSDIKLDPGSVKNFLGLIEKLILDKDKIVRDTIIEYVGEIINPLDKEELPQKIFDFYKNYVNEFYYNKELISSRSNNTNLNNSKNKNEKKDEKIKKEEKEKDIKDKKENVNYYFAYNFPAILFCYGKEVWPKLNSLFFNLCKEKDLKVRRSIIASFHEVSKIVGEKITEEELLPLYDNYLNSKSPLEKNFAIKNLPKILSGVNKETKEKYFKYFDAVSIFQQNMSSKVRNFFFTNWRNKIDVIEGILCYYHLYDKEIIYKSILPQCINFCFDDVYKVRSVSCKIFATLILYLYNENYKKKELFELLELFALHKKYYQRICFAKMCKVLLENINLYNEKLKNLLYILIIHDKSKNVRVALGKSLGKILKNDKFKCIKEISFHKLCKMLNNGKSTSIKNIFSALDIKNCYNVNEEELFNLDDINKIIGNKDKIFDKENTFIKKEFDFDINECQHKYYKREGVILQKKDNINNKDVKEENINININKSGDDKIIDKDKIDEVEINIEKKKDEKHKNVQKIEEKEKDNKKEIKENKKEVEKEEIKLEIKEEIIQDIKEDKQEIVIEDIKNDKKEELKVDNKLEIQEDNKEIKEDKKDEKKKELEVEIQEGYSKQKKEDNKDEKKEELKLVNQLEIQEDKKEEIKETKMEFENKNEKEEEKIKNENSKEKNENEKIGEKNEKKEEKEKNENSNLVLSNNEENQKEDQKENKINENNIELQIDDDSKKENKNENNINEEKEDSIKESDDKNENKIKEEDDDNENKEEKNQNQEGSKKRKRKNKKKK